MWLWGDSFLTLGSIEPSDQQAWKPEKVSRNWIQIAGNLSKIYKLIIIQKYQNKLGKLDIFYLPNNIQTNFYNDHKAKSLAILFMLHDWKSKKDIVKILKKDFKKIECLILKFYLKQDNVATSPNTCNIILF